MDVTKKEQVSNAFEEIRNTVGERGLTALVNNAGVGYPGPAEFIPLEDIEKEFQINVFGVIRVTQAAMPLLRKGTPGRIINIGSIVSELNIPYLSGYNASKAAIQSFSETMRREVERWGIKVSLIKPGVVQTNFAGNSREYGNALKEKFATGSLCYEYYGKDMDHLSEAFGGMEKQGSPPSKVVDTIYRALTVKNPKPIYYDTTGTAFSMGMMSFTPGGVIDRSLAKTFFTS